MKIMLLIRQGQGQLIGQIQEIPGVLTQGHTVAEVKKNIQDALALCPEGTRDDGPENDGNTIAREVLEIA